MASAKPEELATDGSGTHQAENLVLDIPLGVEKDRPLPVKHVYVLPFLKLLLQSPPSSIDYILSWTVTLKSDPYGRQLRARLS